MKIYESKVESRESSAKDRRPGKSGFRPSTFVPRPSSGFTLLELLVVIAILGILAALSVPVLKNFGKSDATLSAARQLLDDVGRARQLAISQRTTVYMVFVPRSFWTNSWVDSSGNFLPAWNTLTMAQKTAATNLCDKQFTGYTFVSLRSVGDQPGQRTMRYLAPWQTLPDGTFIATNKFQSPGTLLSSSAQPLYLNWNTNYPHPDQNRVYSFSANAAIQFPTADSPTQIQPPYIAFNYLGQLTTNGTDMSLSDEYIPVAKGSVVYARDAATKLFQFNAPDALETPPGNSTNLSYNIIHVDRLTGRAVVEFEKVK